MGIDFSKTYAPTGRLHSLRTLMAFACVKKLQFHQIDIKSAFLNAQLKETMYLAVPQGLQIDKQKFCLRLNKAIYGLRQAPLAWYKQLKTWLRSVNFAVCTLDPCVFYRAGSIPVWLYVHVDDIGIFSRDMSIFKTKISKEFNITDVGAADLMLGVKIRQTENGMSLDQQQFIEALLEQYGMEGCKAMVTPLTPNEHLTQVTEEEVVAFKNLKENYRSAIGSINYLSTATRPDLSFAVSALSQYLERPGIKHWQAFMHVLRYLRGSSDRGLHYSAEKNNGITAYSDADWGNCSMTQCSTTGYLACFHKCLLLWKTRKQPMVSISTAEAEYKAVCDLTSELLWFKQWCEEAKLFTFTKPILIFEDNQSCIKTANGDCNINNKQMKHIDIQLHFIKEDIQENCIQLQYVPSTQMLADFLTKSVNKFTLENSLSGLSLLQLGVRGDEEILTQRGLAVSLIPLESFLFSIFIHCTILNHLRCNSNTKLLILRLISFTTALTTDHFSLVPLLKVYLFLFLKTFTVFKNVSSLKGGLRDTMANKTIELKDISNIPLLDGTNYGHWNMRMKIHLRSKDLINVCKKPVPSAASTTIANKWSRASFEAINLITTRVTERVFQEVVNAVTIEKDNLLWAKIEEQYASKRALNRGRVWMDWQRCFYDGNLQNYIYLCRKLMMELEAVSIVVPPELLSYSLLGKLGGDTSLHQFIKNLTLNEDVIEKPEKILTRLQDQAHLNTLDCNQHSAAPTALVSSGFESHKLIYYCAKGKHNKKCSTHKKEDCWTENPHLRPPRREKKRLHFNPTAHLTTAHALIAHIDQQQPKNQHLVINCRATHHMFNDFKPFTSSLKTTNIRVATGDANSDLTALGIGTVEILSNNKTLTLKNCLYVPHLKCNLISLLELFKKELTVKREKDTFTLTSQGKEILNGKIINKLMISPYTIPTALLTSSNNIPWHERLGHPSPAVLKLLGIVADKKDCLICEKSKSHKLPFKHHFEQALYPLDCVHMDVVGPVTPPSVSGNRYFLTIVDQASSFKVVKFLKNKSEVFDQFIASKKVMENLQNRTLKRLVTDRGGEFVNHSFKKLAEDCGYTHIMAPPETPQHNGFAKRANRTILEKTRCLMNQANLPKSYWADAVNTAVLLSNLSLTASTGNQSPHFLWTNTSPKLDKLGTFGCRAVIHNLKRQYESKMEPPGQAGILIGYDNDNSAYRIVCLKDLKVSVTHHTTFNEQVFPKLSTTSKNTLTFFHEDINTSHSPDIETNPKTLNNSDLTTATQASDLTPPADETLDTTERPSAAPLWIRIIGPRHLTLINSAVDNLNILPYKRRTTALLMIADEAPNTYRGAINSENSSLWQKAIEKELTNMATLKIKKDELNNPIEHKAQLCAQGFTQSMGVDFDKTYAPTGRLNSLRTLIAFACINNLQFHQYNIKSAFLNALLKETVYLSIPQGLNLDKKIYCLKLNKAIYGIRVTATYFDPPP
ncbi:hypothetical protein O181_034185 [Austropuccinia psidii MF-1]|uniref:Integrase catalytic domain-containing protein n=1 Tax=Austropuccinia psidii MF-1 TaxID=1389203 RepID=A0A9Q3H9Y2_9BASI|nr:hypothetical protein [Austropuccinia psidii MF-1]